MSTRIHISQVILQHNRKHGTKFPSLIVIQDGETKHAVDVVITGPSFLIDRSDSPLEGTGATMWVETMSPVLLIGESSADDIQELVERTPEIQEAILKAKNRGI